MAYLLYHLLTHLVALVALPFLPLLWWTRHGEGLSERLGVLPPKLRRLDRPIWIHAASVGEVLSAQSLVIALRRHYPSRPIVISTTSLTGRATAQTKLRPDAVMLLPIDVFWIVHRVLRQLRPWCLLVVETELWPALLQCASRRGVPAFMVSGRVTARSTRQYTWAPSLVRTMLGYMQLFAMQTQEDADRLLHLGAAHDRVHVVGSLKYGRDAMVSNIHPSPLRDWLSGRPLFVAASTHPGEEAFVVDACRGLWRDHPDLLLVIAPRRPERFDEVASWLDSQQICTQRRSQLHGPVESSTQVLLLDSIGELFDVFPGCLAAFVGGTVASVGGHNVLEPANHAKPVSFGPNTQNVAPSAESLLAAGAATRVESPADLGATWKSFLDDPARSEEIGRRGLELVNAQADVAERTLALAAPILDGIRT